MGKAKKLSFRLPVILSILIFFILWGNPASVFAQNTPQPSFTPSDPDPETIDPAYWSTYVSSGDQTAFEPTEAISTDTATLVRLTLTSDFDPPSPDPAGLAYLPASNSLLISDSEVNEMSIYFTGENLFHVTLSGNLIDTLTTISYSGEPTGVAYNPANQHLFFSDDNRRWVFELDPGPDGQYDTDDDVVTYFDTTDFGSQDPEGVTFDTWRGHLLVIDGVGEEVYDISPGTNGVFDGVNPGGDDVVTHFDTTSIGIYDPEGIEFNPHNGHLYLLSAWDDLIAETTIDGTIIRYIDLTSINPRMAAGLAYAPASNDPTRWNLFIVDRGIDNGQNSRENDGKLYEISFPTSEPPANQAPIVNAGSDQTITLLEAAVLDGTVTDDGLPAATLTPTWSVVSGTGIVHFGDASQVDTTASFSTADTYVLRLTANDGELESFDEITIIVEAAPANQAPAVDAGSDQTITLPAGVILDGTVTDDGLPTATLITSWSRISGPGTVTFTDAAQVDTTATFSIEGTYVLRLTADDSEFSSYDEVTIIVQPAPANEAPIVDAGPNQTITLPGDALLEGTVEDDGSTPTLSTQWSTVSGPGIVTFADTTLVDTTASFSVDGTYILRLTADDGEYEITDDVTITVLPEPPVNQPPTVYAGPDQIVSANEIVSLDGILSDDGLPDPPGTLTILWKKSRGPGPVKFKDANSLNTTAIFTKKGVFVIRLTISDGEYTVYDEVTITVNP